MYDSIVIIGATATGKTDISIRVAKSLGGEVVNADSMYIYKNLNIGTAKPTNDEMDGIIHHLIGFVNETDTFNVSEYRELAKKEIKLLKEKNTIPIVVGGTGFYVDSLIGTYSYGETGANSKVRAMLQKELEDNDKYYLWEKLNSLDPISASRLHPNDIVRVTRAIEMALTSSKKSDVQNHSEPILKNPLIIGLNMDREVLYDRINKRVDIMLKNGLIDEVKSLYNRGFTPENNQCMKGIGYKEVVAYLRGEATETEMVEKIKQHTRNYAKRQITYFKRNKDIIWFDPIKNGKDAVVEQILMIFREK